MENNEAKSSSEDGYLCDDEMSWIQKYTVGCRGHEMILEVPYDFINNNFSTENLEQIFPNFEALRDQILDLTTTSLDNSIETQKEAEDLYALIHQRYIMTPAGLQQMKHKICRGDIGYCPRVLCKRQPVIPYGVSSKIGQCQTRVYCPTCSRLYDPEYQRHQMVDGAHFGPNFVAEILLTYPGLKQVKQMEIYEPRIFGFKISKLSVYRQQLND